MHAAEPWHVEPCRDGWELCFTSGGESGHLAVFPPATGEADARRAALCVNACAGVPDEALAAFARALLPRPAGRVEVREDDGEA